MRPSLGGEAGHYSRKLLYPHTTRFETAAYVEPLAIFLLFFGRILLFGLRSASADRDILWHTINRNSVAHNGSSNREERVPGKYSLQ